MYGPIVIAEHAKIGKPCTAHLIRNLVDDPIIWRAVVYRDRFCPVLFRLNTQELASPTAGTFQLDESRIHLFEIIFKSHRGMSDFRLASLAFKNKLMVIHTVLPVDVYVGRIPPK